MKARAWLLTVALAMAAAAPLLPKATLPAAGGTAVFPGWPETFEGRRLQPMSAGPQDRFFTRDFPGRVARFASADRQVVIRWVNAPTRRLHPATQCFEGAGYQIEPRPMRRAADGALMSCFAAHKHSEALLVCEQLRDERGSSWPDVSAWYWSALAAPAGSGWWSYVIVEHER